MMPFISLSLLYRRVTLILALLLVLAFTFLVIDHRRSSYDDTASRSYNVFDKIRTFGAGQIPDAFRPSTYLGTTTIKEPTTREEWESFAAALENVEDGPRTRSKWHGLKQGIGNLFYRVSFTSLFSHHSYSTQYATDWQDLPPNIKVFKEWEFSRGMVYQGTGTRVQRFLEKARSGRGIVVSVVGGSVSKGRGLPEDKTGHLARDRPIPDSPSAPSRDKRSIAEDWHIDQQPSVSQNLYNPLNLHYQIFQFINRTFPATSQSSHDSLGRGYRGQNMVSVGAFAQLSLQVVDYIQRFNSSSMVPKEVSEAITLRDVGRNIFQRIQISF